MKKIIIKLFLWSISVLMILIFLLNVGPHIFPSLVTIYSEDFNKQSFKNLSIGEDKKVVEYLLGKPLRESISNTNRDSIKDVYWYTKGKYFAIPYEKIFILFYEDKVSDIVRVIDMD